MIFVNGDVPTAMIVSLHLFVQFMYNYWIRSTETNNSQPDIIILSSNKEDYNNNNNNEENNNIYVSIPDMVKSNKKTRTIVPVKQVIMSDTNQTKENNNNQKTVLKSVFKSVKNEPETGICFKCHQNVVEKFDNQPFAPIHLGAEEIRAPIVYEAPIKKEIVTNKKKVHYSDSNTQEHNPFIKIKEKDQEEEKKEDLFFRQTGKTADSSLLLDDISDDVPKPIKKERRESIKQDRLNISYHLELFNDGPLVPETQKSPEIKKSPAPIKKFSSPFIGDRGNLLQTRVHKVSNPLIQPTFQPTIQIENYDSASPPSSPSSPTAPELPATIIDTPISSDNDKNPLIRRDSRSVSPKSTFNAQKIWFDMYDRIRRHEELPIPPQRQTRSYESLYSNQGPPTCFPSTTSITSTRLRKISNPNPPTQPLMKSIDISNLGHNDDLFESNKKWMTHDTKLDFPVDSSKEEKTFADIKQRSRKISRNRRSSILDPPAPPSVIYKCVYSFRSANAVDTQCSCNVIIVNFDTFNDREIDALELESNYIKFLKNHIF